MITPLGLSGLINFVASLSLGLFVLFKNPLSATNRSYFYLNASVAFFSINYLFWQLSATPDLARTYFFLLTIGIVLINPTYIHFVLNFLGEANSKKQILYGCYALNFLFLAAHFFGGLYTDLIPKYGYGYWPVAKPLFNFYLVVWAAQCLYGYFLLIRKLNTAPSQQEKNQVKYFLVSAIIGFVGGASNWPLWYGLPFPPHFNYFITIYIAIVGYAIIKHGLMDIEVVIKRTAVFAGLFAFVYGAFTFISVLSQAFFDTTLKWGSQVSLIVTVAFITFSLKPLETLLTNITERFLFQKKYDYRALLRTFSNEILTILDLQKLLDQTVLQLLRILKLDCACILLHQKEEKSYTIVAAAGLKEKDVVFHEDDLLIRSLKEGHHPIQKDKTAESVAGDGRLKEDFKKIRAHLCLPIMLHDELIGILALGMKKSGDDYTPEDVDILSTLARTEAIAISNAQLFDELSKTQAEAAQREKMAVIGTLAAGINHEICNPLGIVRGQCEMFLLNMRDGLYHDKTPEQLIQISSDIMTKVIKETDRATGITKKLSSFAKPSKKNEAEEVSVAREVEEILGLLGHDLKLSNIDFRYNLPKDFPGIMVDRKQFQEVLFNIIRNAAQAMDKKSGFIEIGGFMEHGYAAIKISDNGMGIPREKISQIFNPFFTTKAPGKGTGLGLFIVKQVVERNKGTIEVESVEGEGTSFVLKFPAASKLVAA